MPILPMEPQAILQANVSVTVWRDAQTRQFIVHSPALDLSSCGKTEPQALRAFAEAADLYIRELERLGTFEEVLRELGWRKVARPRQHWVPPELLKERSVPLRLPAHA